MTLPASSRSQLTPDLDICRILNGMWQVSGAHGPIDPSGAIEEMFSYHDAGFTTWDLADHYGPAEDFVGTFRRQFAARYGVERLSEIQAFTKWVLHPGRMTRRVVEDAIAVSLSRMRVDCLDLLQFRWWDYHNRSYLDALGYLAVALTKIWFATDDPHPLCRCARCLQHAYCRGRSRLHIL